LPIACFDRNGTGCCVQKTPQGHGSPPPDKTPLLLAIALIVILSQAKNLVFLLEAISKPIFGVILNQPRELK
jgi:hypothetical protein